ncbi:MAG: 6-pyruvoyl tetrahydropterin synthase family protein [Bryobacteraceae bacterium]
MFITRKIEFSASHVCASPQLTEEENRALYGPEANPRGHGHNYEIEVTVAGEPEAATGMVMDLKRLKEVLTREVASVYDHRFLNREVPPFDRVVPTVENIAVDIWNRLHPHLRDARCRLHAVRVYETGELWADYFGEGA